MVHSSALQRLSLAVVAVAALATPAAAQESRFGCEDRSFGQDARHCEIRDYRLPPTSSVLNVNARPNGSIEVIGSARSDIRVRAKVVANAPTEQEARQIASAVQVRASAGEVTASGPSVQDRRGWSVSYQVLVPTQTWLSLQSTNGAIRIENVEAEIDFRTTNGAVSLARLGGQVKGSTTNGAVRVALAGPSWLGEGLDVETTNGAVQISVPDGYSARLQAHTTNGRTRVDFPVTMDGRLDRGLDVTLGSGGPMVKVVTRNGGIHLSREK
jgi:hypothetical protein